MEKECLLCENEDVVDVVISFPKKRPIKAAFLFYPRE
jgi:hypothetical protein